MGLANPNLPCCSSCGDEGLPEAFLIYRYELICRRCHAEHEATRHAEGCDECEAKGVALEETAGGDLLCVECMQAKHERDAERAEDAAASAYYGGECDAAVYERNNRRAV